MFDEGENRGNSSPLAQTGNKTRLIPNYILIERRQSSTILKDSKTSIYCTDTFLCVHLCIGEVGGGGGKGEKEI